MPIDEDGDSLLKMSYNIKYLKHKIVFWHHAGLGQLDPIPFARCFIYFPVFATVRPLNRGWENLRKVPYRASMSLNIVEVWNLGFRDKTCCISFSKTISLLAIGLLHIIIFHFKSIQVWIKTWMKNYKKTFHWNNSYILITCKEWNTESSCCIIYCSF